VPLVFIKSHLQTNLWAHTLVRASATDLAMSIAYYQLWLADFSAALPVPLPPLHKKLSTSPRRSMDIDVSDIGLESLG
jgi:hypothetical protein